MSRRLPLSDATRARSPEIPANGDRRWLSPVRQFLETVNAWVLRLIGVLASAVAGTVAEKVTNAPRLGIGAAMVMLGLLIAMEKALSPRQPQPTGTTTTPLKVPVGTPLFGVLPFLPDPGLALLLSGVASSSYAESTAGSSGTGPVINLVKESQELDAALEAERSNVILVHGPPGAGKTTLVSSVLGKTASKSKARLHDLAFGDQIDAKTLLDDIESLDQVESGMRTGAGLQPGEDLLGCLKAKLEAPGGSPGIIVVDGAQSLFDPDNRIKDRELAEALEVIASGRPRQVKVILVVEEPPAPGPGSAWHGTADRVFVGGLHRPAFRTFLERLNPAFEFGVSDRTTAGPGRLYDVLEGNPRQAELFCAALGLPGSTLSASDLVQQLDGKQVEEREKLLASKVMDRLSADQQNVVAALAAYGIPVTIGQVSRLLDGKLPAGQVDVLVPELVNWRVIGRVADKASDRYYLLTGGIANELPPTVRFRKLLSDAVNQLEHDLTPKEKIHELKDLRWHFAKLDAWFHIARIDADSSSWVSAYNQIDEVDQELGHWNAAGLLLKYRKAIVGKLDSYLEMVNSNALGCIYMSRGRFDDARQAFDYAIGKAGDPEAPEASEQRWKVLINLAALEWNRGNISDAEEKYAEALAEYRNRDHAKATDDGDALALIAAENGLADCYRRWGRFSDAIDHGNEALPIARRQGSSSLVGIAVKLARWYSELGQRRTARQLMREASRVAGRDTALRARYLAGHADLLLDHADRFRMVRLRRVKRVTKKALKKVPRAPDADTVLHATTALAMAHLMLGDTKAARQAIAPASRCRRAGRFLDVLALQALIAFRSDPDGEEAREFFATLRREADDRKHDEQDFAARAFAGLAICGLQVGGTAPLSDDAAQAFRESKDIRERAEDVPVPGLDVRLRQWLEVLQSRDKSGQLAPVMAVVNGDVTGPERSRLR